MEPPQAFLCPITYEVMETPAVAPDGRSYGRAAIEQWLSQNATSPITRQDMPLGELVLNYALRDAIQEWQTEAANRARLLELSEPEDVIASSFGKVVGGLLKRSAASYGLLSKCSPNCPMRRLASSLTRSSSPPNGSAGATGVCRLIGTCEKVDSSAW